MRLSIFVYLECSHKMVRSISWLIFCAICLVVCTRPTTQLQPNFDMFCWVCQFSKIVNAFIKWWSCYGLLEVEFWFTLEGHFRYHPQETHTYLGCPEDITRLGSTYSYNLETQRNRKEENMIFLQQKIHPVLHTSPLPVTSSSFVIRVARFPNFTPVPCVPTWKGV